jgi:CheY-like chemotaxis protein
LPNARRILVVDNDEDSVEMLATLLRVQGHEVHTAHDGLEAVGAALAFQPEVVLMDLSLPTLSGYEAARRIREQMGAGGVILVALTGWGRDEDRRRTTEAGFDYHMTKPLEFDDFQNVLAAAPRNPR